VAVAVALAFKVEVLVVVVLVVIEHQQELLVAVLLLNLPLLYFLAPNTQSQLGLVGLVEYPLVEEAQATQPYFLQ
jgi:hypothetical protein